jgi:uncharacterized cupin superfamily protein
MSGEEGQPDVPVVLPFNVDEVPWDEWSEGIRFGSRVKRLGKHGGGSRVGVLIEELAPHKQSVPLHWHSREEEHIWVLAGRATLRLGDARHPIKAGDYVCFPAGRALGHCMVNDSDEPCRYLVIGERSPDDVCVYPDSGKVLIVNAGHMLVPLLDGVDYWKDEKADQPPC